MEKKEADTLDYLRRLCSAREYSRRDVVEKALRRVEVPAIAERIADTLQAEGFQSDLRYASAYARDKSAIAGWGPAKIRYMLGGKGIGRDIIDRALEEIDSGKADEKLRKTLLAKYKLLQSDPQVKIKLLKFALSRGYGYEAVHKVVSEILHGKNENLQQFDGGTDFRP